ncbi:hypothetical protein [Citrobacter sp. Res13-Sevr-PEB04-36]|uniref:hypothetical protein n=1 Tax=Citrobacter sp. Res13-Sevr-PEB04-36 TaxID=2777960 RepID=UPI001E4A44B6|nr:hypothetical protein [Citrobacter sp. Res13-Sevr-PEB04-36]
MLPRTLVSFSALMVIIAIPIMYFAPRLKHFALIPAITSLAFSAQLSNAMNVQYKYDIFGIIAKDIAGYESIATIGTVGGLDLSERAKLLAENKPLIKHFLSPATEFLASYQLINKGLSQTKHGYDNENENKDQLNNMTSKGAKPVSSNKYYSLFVSGNNAIVFLGKYNN